MTRARTPSFRTPSCGRTPRRLLPAALLTVAAVSPTAQEPVEAGEVAFRQACLDASMDALVLNCAAHPDDEAASTTTVLRHRYGVRTVTVYSTCGEGGQNAIGREIGPALAAIRVRETLRAAAYTGTEVRWLGFADFGYSKTREETIARWGGDDLLEKMARTIHDVAPDVVLTNHSVDAGHGHHRATAWALTELCPSAGPNGSVLPLYRRARGRDDAPSFDPGQFDPLRGRTHARVAHDGWTQHASQGPWRPHDPTRVRPTHWLQVVPPTQMVAPGPDAGPDAEPRPAPGKHPLDRLGSMFDEPAVAEALDEPMFVRLQTEFRDFREDMPRARHVDRARRLLPLMRDLLEKVESTSRTARARVTRRIDALERVVLHGAGIQLQVHVPERAAKEGETVEAAVRLVGPFGLEGLRITCRGVEAEPRGEDGGSAAAGGWLGLPLTLDREGEGAEEPDLVAALTGTRRFTVEASFEHLGVPLTARRTVEIAVEPALRASFARQVVYRPTVLGAPDPAAAAEDVPLAISWAGPEPLAVAVDTRRSRWLTSLDGRDVVLEPGTRAKLDLGVALQLAGAPRPPNAGYELLATVRGEEVPLSARAALRVVPVGRKALEEAWRTLDAARGSEAKIGLVRGPDDTVEGFLSQVLGSRLVVLDDASFLAQLPSCATVFLDIRAYHHRPALGRFRDDLLAFVRDGGRVVCSYHKPGEWNETEGRPLLSPHPLKVGRSRVAEEDAPVTILEPDHPLWNRPYAITAEDFDDWVQERGLNFPEEWGVSWLPLMSAHDTGEEPLQGGLLYASHGKGDWVHCSLSLYRQIRAGHYGVARLLLNLVTPVR